MRKRIPILLTLMTSLSLGYCQFSVRFDDESFTAKGYQAIYSFQSGQLLMLTDTPGARQEGYIFPDSNTGEKLSSFLLDNDHGGLLTPDGSELLIAGRDGSLRTMGRYNPTTPQPWRSWKESKSTWVTLSRIQLV